MGLFDFKKKDSSPAKDYGRRYELEAKAKSGKAMSAEEYSALQRYRTRDVWDQIFRIAGVVTILAVIMLAVFIFLYPYSLFNLFPTSAGKGDVFWKMLGAWHVYVGDNTDTYLGYIGSQHGGYVEMQEIYNVAFQSVKIWTNAVGETIEGATGFDFKCGVYVIGSWTIVIVATVGFIAAVLGSGYILAYNIRNLIGVIRHLTQKTGETLTGIGTTAKEAFEEAVPEAKNKKTKKKKEPVEETRRVEEEKVEEPKIGGYTSDELDALLRGESVGEPSAATDKKDLFTDDVK